MRCFGRDDNNDLMLAGGAVSVVSGLQATLQTCEHVAKARLGEMVLNVGAGLPYFETVWAGTPNPAPWEAAFRARVLQVDGVLEISDLTIALEGDTMTYSATIVTTFGTGVIGG